MKAALLLLSFAASGFALETLAQAWCLPGAQWHHEFPYTSWGAVGYVETHYAGDVLFADSVCQEFVHTEHAYQYQSNSVTISPPGSFHTTTVGGTVYLWTFNVGFDTLFHFSAVPGDHWALPGESDDILTRILVTDTGHVLVDGRSSKFLAVEVTYGSWAFVSDTLIEHIGPMDLFLNMNDDAHWLIDGGYGGLRCYNDEEITVSRVGGPCEIALGTPSVPSLTPLLVYPNPATDAVTVRWNRSEELIYVALLDMSGREHRRWPVQSTMDQALLPIDGIAAGQYVLQLASPQASTRVLFCVTH